MTIVGSYAVLFRVMGEVVRIERVAYAGRDLPGVLDSSLKNCGWEAVGPRPSRLNEAMLRIGALRSWRSEQRGSASGKHAPTTHGRRQCSDDCPPTEHD